MRLFTFALLLASAGCTMNNPAFMVSAGDDESSGGDGNSGTAGSTTPGSTTRPGDSTGDPPTTTATPSTSTTDGPDPVTTTAPATTDPGETTSTSTGVDPNETTTLDPSSGNIMAQCGNGIVEEGEQCDQAQFEPVPEKCAPDCQAMIGKRRIFAANVGIKGSFMKLADADAECQEAAATLMFEGNFKALVSDGEMRLGSIDPYDGKATLDWPLRPYTAYFNGSGELVWITLKRPLLGVGAENEGLALPHPIQANANYSVWTGLQSDWRSGPNCGEWTGDGEPGLVGKPSKQDIYIDAGPQPCEIAMGLICVQQ